MKKTIAFYDSEAIDVIFGIKLIRTLFVLAGVIFSFAANAAVIYTQTYTPDKVLSKNQGESYFFDLTPAYNPLTDVVQYLYVDYVFSEIEDNDVEGDFTTWEAVQFNWYYYLRIYIPDIDNETIRFGGYRDNLNGKQCDVWREWRAYDKDNPPTPDDCLRSVDFFGNLTAGFVSRTDNLRIETVTFTAHILKPDANVPEPGTWVLLTTGLLGVVGFSRRRKRILQEKKAVMNNA